jgi:hypothetical protein
MAVDLRATALKWGVVALAAQAYLALKLIAEACDEAQETIIGTPTPVLLERLSQLKPQAFKSPWNITYFVLFLLVGATIVGGMVVVARKRLKAPQ